VHLVNYSLPQEIVKPSGCHWSRLVSSSGLGADRDYLAIERSSDTNPASTRGPVILKDGYWVAAKAYLTLGPAEDPKFRPNISLFMGVYGADRPSESDAHAQTLEYIASSLSGRFEGEPRYPAKLASSLAQANSDPVFRPSNVLDLLRDTEMVVERMLGDFASKHNADLAAAASSSP
jgi:hypothetical protein